MKKSQYFLTLLACSKIHPDLSGNSWGRTVYFKYLQREECTGSCLVAKLKLGGRGGTIWLPSHSVRVQSMVAGKVQKSAWLRAVQQDPEVMLISQETRK